MAEETTTSARPQGFKRIIVCCDGTWMNALGKDSAEPPSNATRISRGIRNVCHDFTPQIIYYHAGVGSDGTTLGSLEGMFGMGLSKNIREVYNFLCANYAEGDDIILTGFSRGAFTARSVADMIGSLGLLTPEGLDNFYAISHDYEDIGDENRDPGDYLCPTLAAYEGQKGQARISWEDDRLATYTNWLKEKQYTKTTFDDGKTEIKVKALGVFETVGVLGIKANKSCTWKFTNTRISNKVENAFHALGLDEPRYDFRPALWERVGANTTNLRQVWFPGSHANIGGGWHDQQIANIALAWMCDQLSSIGVEFDLTRMERMFMDDLRYSAAHPFPYVPSSLLHRATAHLHHHDTAPKPWAAAPIFSAGGGTTAAAKAMGTAALAAALPPTHDAAECPGKERCGRHYGDEVAALWATARAWSLGQTRVPTSGLQMAAGQTVRRPGMALRVDPASNEDTDEPLLRTDERVHSSVRVRLAAAGLAMDDQDVWRCRGLLRAGDDDDDDDGKDAAKGGLLWRLEQGSGFDEHQEAAVRAFRPRELDVAGGAAYPEEKLYPAQNTGQWRWAFAQGQAASGHGVGEMRVPQALVLPEEPLVGYWERLLLALNAGKEDVWAWANDNPPRQAMAAEH